MKVTHRHVLLALVAACLSFGGSFTCHSKSHSDDHVHVDGKSEP